MVLYGLELLLPTERIINCLEAFQRKFVKEILRLPDNTANAAVYLLSGLLPIEAQIHIQALTFLHTICSQDTNSIEWALLVRQISFKSVDSSSWLIQDSPFALIGIFCQRVRTFENKGTVTHRDLYARNKT